jgi:WD40 repeat protein
MSRFAASATLFVVLPALAQAAAPVPVVPPDPLPKGATARLGSLAFRGPTMHGLTFSPDGKRLLVTQNWELLSWDVDTGKPSKAKSLAPAGRTGGAGVVVVNDRVFAIEMQAEPPGQFKDPVGTVTVLDLASGQELSQIPCDGYVNFATNIYPKTLGSVAASADGRYVALISTANKSVDVYEADTGKKLHSQKIDDTYSGACLISPDNKTLYLLQAKKAVIRYELVSGKALPDLDGTDHLTNMLGVSPDGKLVVTRGSVLQKGADGRVVSVVREDFLTVRDAVANKTVGKLAVGCIPEQFAFAGPDTLIVLGLKYRSPMPPAVTLSRWNLGTLRREWEVSGPSLSYTYQDLTVSPDGRRVAISDRQCSAYVYDAATGKLVVEPSGHAGWVAWVGFLAGGERIATVGQDGVRTWNLKGERKSIASLPELSRGRLHPSQLGEHLVWLSHSEDGKEAELLGWNREKSEIAWRMKADVAEHARVLTNDGKRVVVVASTPKPPLQEVTVYDGPAGKKLHSWSFNPDQIDSGGLGPTALSPDGEVLYVGGKGVAVLDVTTGKEKTRLEVGELRRVEPFSTSPLAVSPDGGRLAVVTDNKNGRGRTLRVYDVKAGKEVAFYDLGEAYQPGVRFSPNGKSVAVWNVWGATVQVCDAESSLTAPRKLECGSYHAWCAAFSPNSASLVVGYQDGTALVWDLTAK